MQRRGPGPARPPGAYRLEEGRDSPGGVDTGTGDLLSLDKLLGTGGLQGGRLCAWCRWGCVEVFGNSFMKDRRQVYGRSGGDRHGAGFGTLAVVAEWQSRCGLRRASRVGQPPPGREAVLREI